jgi:hypothetical protein
MFRSYDHLQVEILKHYGVSDMLLDDGRMTETCCGNNIRRGEEGLLR